MPHAGVAPAVRLMRDASPPALGESAIMPFVAFLGHAGLAIDARRFRLLADPWYAVLIPRYPSSAFREPLRGGGTARRNPDQYDDYRPGWARPRHDRHGLHRFLRHRRYGVTAPAGGEEQG